MQGRVLVFGDRIEGPGVSDLAFFLYPWNERGKTSRESEFLGALADDLLSVLFVENLEVDPLTDELLNALVEI